MIGRTATSALAAILLSSSFITSAFGPSAISMRKAIFGDRSLRSFKKADTA